MRGCVFFVQLPLLSAGRVLMGLFDPQCIDALLFRVLGACRLPACLLRYWRSLVHPSFELIYPASLSYGFPELTEWGICPGGLSGSCLPWNCDPRPRPVVSPHLPTLLPATNPPIRAITKKTRKMKNSICAIPAAAPAIPP